MSKRKILIQIDSDPLASVFDRVVAVDAGADEIFSYGGIKPEMVATLVHGAIFTRGSKDLHCTAFFVGGSDVSAGDALLKETIKHMQPAYGLRVSVMLDSNGANTTAAAAVHAASRHVDLATTKALVLGGTGPVGQRVALLMARQGTEVRLASRQLLRAKTAVEAIQARVPGAQLTPLAISNEAELVAALSERTVVVAAGAAGVTLLPRTAQATCPTLKVLIDLNAVAPLGIETLEVFDTGKERDGVFGYGALGVGGTKMKLHRAAVAKLFERNDQVLDAEEIYQLALAL